MAVTIRPMSANCLAKACWNADSVWLLVSWSELAEMASMAALVPGGDRFSRHVVEHLLLGMVAPVLLALGAPVTLALQGAGPGTRASLRRALRHPLVAWATHPVVAFVAFSASMWVLWLSPLYRLSLDHAVVHEAVHAHLLLVGFAFAATVLGADPVPWRPAHGLRALAVGLTLPLHGLLGLVVLSMGGGVLNPRLGPAEAVDDQQLGAALLWGGGELAAGGLLVLVLLGWMRADRLAARREDRLATAEASP